MSAATYAAFLERKTQLDGQDGFEPSMMPDQLFPFQVELVAWAVRKGRAALFADCGLGKTPMQLAWAENVRRHTDKPVLIITPLAVAHQTEGEAHKFGIEAAVSRHGLITGPITITNYERLHLFDPSAFGGAVCDESSAIKAFDGVRRAQVTDFMRKMRYRLLCTATAAPNDYIELGTSSEALGYLGHMDMLSRFFTNSQHSAHGNRHWSGAEWRFKGHAEDAFWRWVSSWARALRKPSDLGFDDAGFDLPPLNHRQHVVTAKRPPEGMLFDLPAMGLREERDESRRTLEERCEKAASLVEGHDVSILWCNLNAEGDALERLVPHSIQVKGSDSSDYKEAAAQWFTGTQCLCDLPEFRGKLAAWRGSPNMLPTGEPDTGLTLPSASAERHKGERPMRTANTCGTTTLTTPNGSGVHPSSRPNTIGVGESGTPVTPSSANVSSAKLGSCPLVAGPTGSVSSTESPSLITTRYSNGRAADVRSAGPVAGSTSTTAIPPAPPEGSSAPNATSALASSGTTRPGSSGPRCICGHESGVRRLITKSRMFGLGLNFQHCNHMVFFPSHSYEQYYQAVRRCWRFGQKYPVTVDIVTTEGGVGALRNLERKAAQADRMFDALTEHMRDALSVDRSQHYPLPVEVPAWLAS